MAATSELASESVLDALLMLAELPEEEDDADSDDDRDDDDEVERDECEEGDGDGDDNSASEPRTSVIWLACCVAAWPRTAR